MRRLSKKGEYLYAIVRNHPNSTANDYVLFHRIVMENHLGRILTSNEIVHHKNENKKDNRIENLELMLAGEHIRKHVLERGYIEVALSCPNCELLFFRRKGDTHLQKGGKFTACSARCRGKFSSLMQYNGLTAEVEKAISVNVQFERRRFHLENTEQTQDNVDA